ncbi:MAG TPA: glycosyltransferase family 4 protein [Candidatus Eubacterium faecavium]|nr:glycosyltransferase family 4 protein [Candidatus Eubacterium faecavium]
MMEKSGLKIAMIGHKRVPSREGGVEIVVEELSRRMACLGNKVDVYNRSGSHVSGSAFDSIGSELPENIRVITIPTPENKTLNAFVYSFLASLRALFGRYDVIHFHAEGPAAMCFLPKLFGIRTVVTIHGLDWQRSKWGGFASKYLKFGEKTAARCADEIIVLSDAVRDYFKKEYGRNTVYIPNGITQPDFEEIAEAGEKYGLKKDRYILYLGRIVPEKGIHYLIEAYSDMKTDMPLVIAGGSSHSEEYFARLKRSAEGKNIIFTDFVQGRMLRELYSNAYLYVLPSDLEGMPISLLEAMSYSNCCLTSDIPECTQVCGENAVYFRKSSVDDLKNKLEYLIKNSDTVLEYKSRAHDYIISKYSWDDVVNRTLALYRGEPLENTDSK